METIEKIIIFTLLAVMIITGYIGCSTIAKINSGIIPETVKSMVVQ